MLAVCSLESILWFTCMYSGLISDPNSLGKALDLLVHVLCTFSEVLDLVCCTYTISLVIWWKKSCNCGVFSYARQSLVASLVIMLVTVYCKVISLVWQTTATVVSLVVTTQTTNPAKVVLLLLVRLQLP